MMIGPRENLLQTLRCENQQWIPVCEDNRRCHQAHGVFHLPASRVSAGRLEKDKGFTENTMVGILHLAAFSGVAIAGSLRRRI